MLVNDDLNPIRTLYDDIIHYSTVDSNATTETRIEALINENKLSKSIMIYASMERIRPARVNFKTKQIELQTQYLCFLWCMIYINMELLEVVTDEWDEDKAYFDLGVVKGLEELDKVFNWANSLKEGYSAWPTDLPSPTHERDKIKYVNYIFKQAARYVMYHEIAHLANNHSNYLDLITKATSSLSETDQSTLKELEIEADNYAYECLVAPWNTESEIVSKIIGAAIAQLSNLWLIDTTAHLISTSHPDIDNRMFNLMHKVRFETSAFQTTLDLVYNINLSLFLKKFAVPYEKSETILTGFATFNDVLMYLYQHFDDLKRNK